MAFRRLSVPPELATGGKIVNVETVTSGAAVTYEASYTKGGRTRELAAKRSAGNRRAPSPHRRGFASDFWLLTSVSLLKADGSPVKD